MPTQFKHVVNTDIGTTPVDIYTAPTGFSATAIGCNLTNITTFETVNVNVFVVDSSSTAAYYVKNLTIPPETTVKLITNGEKLILPQSATLRIESDIDNTIDAIVSIVELS
jgi:hypothetical protein